MDMDDHLPLRSGDPVGESARQDLDALSVEELEARIAALKAEIGRTERKLEHAVSHRASADKLFRS